MTEREKLLNRVRMYDFALVDVIEYLDGHPKNTAALAYYSEMRTAFDKAAAEYEDAFGPLTAREVDTRPGFWRWIDEAGHTAYQSFSRYTFSKYSFFHANSVVFAKSRFVWLMIFCNILMLVELWKSML